MMNRGMNKAVVALALVAAGVMSVGCDQQGEVSQTLSTVEHQLATAHPGDASAATPTVREQIYNQAVSSLTGVSHDATGAQRDAVNVLLAESYSGLSLLDAQQAGQTERRLLDSEARLRAQLDLYIAQTSLADALAAVDSTKEFAALDRALNDVDVSMSDAQRALRAMQKQADQLKSQADAKARQASDLRAQAGALRSKALEAPTDQIAALSQRAYETQRQAAAGEVESSRLAAQRQKITPRIAEQKALIASLGEERVNLTNARQRVDTRVQIVRQNSQEARAKALAAEQEVTQKLDTIDAIVTGDLASHWRQAIEHAQKALSAVNQVRGLDRTTIAVSKGEAQQRLGELQGALARGLERYRLELRAIQGAGPVSTIASKATEILTRIEPQIAQARQDSRDAFEQAGASYAGASVRDASARDRLDRIKKLLAELAQNETSASDQSDAES